MGVEGTRCLSVSDGCEVVTETGNDATKEDVAKQDVSRSDSGSSKEVRSRWGKVASGESVLFVHHGDYGGGAPFSMLYTAQVAREIGLRPRMLLLNPSEQLYSLYRDSGFDVDELSGVMQWYYYAAAPMPWWRPSTYKQLCLIRMGWKKSKNLFQDYLKENPVDIVHLNSVVLINLADALKEMGQRYVWHVREHGPPNKDWRYRIFQRRLLDSPEVIFNSELERRSWVGDSGHGTVAHNFVPSERFNQTVDGRRVRQELKIPDETTVILFVGGIRRHKGGEHFLRAMSLVRKARPEHDFVLLMPGSLTDDRQRDQNVREVIAKHGLDDCCRLLPFVADIDSYIAAGDLLVFPSRVPHFARPVVEAAAMKTPVILSDIPPMTEFVADGENAWVASCGDDKSLADKVLDALSNPNRLREMGERIHHDFRERFSIDAQAAKIASVYDRILN